MAGGRRGLATCGSGPAQMRAPLANPRLCIRCEFRAQGPGGVPTPVVLPAAPQGQHAPFFRFSHQRARKTRQSRSTPRRKGLLAPAVLSTPLPSRGQQPQAHRPPRRPHVHRHPFLGDHQQAAAGQGRGGIAGGLHQAAPGTWRDAARNFRRAARHPRSPRPQQGQDGGLQVQGRGGRMNGRGRLGDGLATGGSVGRRALCSRQRSRPPPLVGVVSCTS